MTRSRHALPETHDAAGAASAVGVRGAAGLWTVSQSERRPIRARCLFEIVETGQDWLESFAERNPAVVFEKWCGLHGPDHGATVGPYQTEPVPETTRRPHA